MPRHSLRPAASTLLALLACACLASSAPATTLTSAPAAPATDADIAALAARLEGGWVGEATNTPMGPMPFAFAFVKDEAGALRAHTAMNAETFIELSLARSPGGGWTLVETAGLEGLGVQSQALSPAPSARPGFVRFATEDPAFMHVDFAADAATLVLEVTIRGALHARFDLRRIPDAEVPALSARLAQAARTATPAPKAAHDSAAPDAAAQVALGQRLLAEMATNPASGPVNAPLFLRALRTAVALDPTLAEPHRLLAIYHLNAPAIGGGSVEKALEEARLFARLDPEHGAPLVAEIERRIQ